MPERDRQQQQQRQAACQICQAPAPGRNRQPTSAAVPGRGVRTLEATNIARRDNVDMTPRTTPTPSSFEPAD